MEGTYRQSAALVVPYIVLGSFLPVTAGGAIAFTVDLLTNDHSDTPAAGLAVLWLIALGNGGAIALIAGFRRERRRRWRGIADAIATRLSGRVWTTGADWVGWLNAMWAGPYAITNLLLGPYFHAVTGALGGFAVAVDLDPVPASSEHGAPRADVLLAACLPDDRETVAVPAVARGVGGARGRGCRDAHAVTHRERGQVHAPAPQVAAARRDLPYNAQVEHGGAGEGGRGRSGLADGSPIDVRSPCDDHGVRTSGGLPQGAADQPARSGGAADSRRSTAGDRRTGRRGSLGQRESRCVQGSSADD
jgi:hypothetical protein